jgi:hypothetical protein
VNLRKLFVWAVFIISTMLIFSCSFTRTKAVEPAFSLTLDSISRDINSLIVTPEASVTGEEITTDGNTTTELTINLINSKGLPDNVDEQKKIGEYIAILIKNTLKDPNSFTDYKVLFTNRTVDGAITKSTYVGYSYKSTELKNYIQMVSVGNQFDSLTHEAIGHTSFTSSDPKIISVFIYYNNVPGSPLKFNLYKETDSASVLIMSEDQGQILRGNNYLEIQIPTADIYKAKHLGSGKYRFDYLVSDTIAGSKYFTLQ